MSTTLLNSQAHQLLKSEQQFSKQLSRDQVSYLSRLFRKMEQDKDAKKRAVHARETAQLLREQADRNRTDPRLLDDYLTQPEK